MSHIRPFAARVVRRQWAQRAVVALTELPEGTVAAPATQTVDPAAYDEAPPALYVYRQERDGFFHVGVVCEVGIPAFVDGRVRGHEAVQERRVEALVRHHATTSAPPALVALLHTPGEAFTRTLASIDAMPPILDFAGPEGRRQTVWRVTEGATGELVDELAAADLYVADGHHRVAAALSEWREGGGPQQAGLLCIVHALDGLRLSAFHRRVAGPVPPDQVLGALAHGFEVARCSAEPTPTPGSFGLYVAGDWFQVRVGSVSAAWPRPLDVELLHERVLAPLDRSIEIARAKTSVDDLVRRCDEDGGALFTLAPPPLSELTRLADAGEVMPPKTTYFEPKPCAGVFLRPDAAEPAPTGDMLTR